MKKHLLTVAMAIVAIGAAVAGTANLKNSQPVKKLVTFYENPGCTQVECGNFSGPQCSNYILYPSSPCTPGQEQTNVSGNRQ